MDTRTYGHTSLQLTWALFRHWEHKLACTLMRLHRCNGCMVFWELRALSCEGEDHKLLQCIDVKNEGEGSARYVMQAVLWAAFGFE
jgi:hypothetical protein